MFGDLGHRYTDHFVRVEATSVRAGTAPGALRALVARWVLVSLALAAVLAALVGLAFAGSTARIADGVAIAGIDVGGLTPKEARTLLEQRFDRVARIPVVFTAGGERYPIKATTLGVEADWAAAIETAAREGEGFGPVRGFRRLQARFFGAEISPPVQAYGAALDFKIAGLAEAIDQSHVEAKLVRRGLGSRSSPVSPAAGSTRRPQARPSSARSRDSTAGSRWRSRFASIRSKSQLPTWPPPHGRPAPPSPLPSVFSTRELAGGYRAGGSPSSRRCRSQARQRSRSPGRARKPGSPAAQDRRARAGRRRFEVKPGGIDVVPDKPGLGIDVPATAKALLAAATSPTARTADLAVRTTRRRAHRRPRRRRWGSPASSAATTRSTAASRTASTTSRSSRS